MTGSRVSSGLTIVVVLLCGLTVARDAAATSDRRAELAAERAAIDKRHAEQEQACRTRFVVTSCLDETRERRRAALAPVRREELRIDTEERKQRAAARLGVIESKQRADAAREAASSPEAEPRAASSAREPPRPASRPGGGPSRPAVSAGERARREDRSQAKFEQRQADAERHRAAVEARNAERAAKGKVVKPLPVAPGASAL